MKNMLVLIVSMFSGIRAVSVAMEPAQIMMGLSPENLCPSGFKFTSIGGNIELQPDYESNEIVVHLTQGIWDHCKQDKCAGYFGPLQADSDDVALVQTCRRNCQKHFMGLDWSHAIKPLRSCIDPSPKYMQKALQAFEETPMQPPVKQNPFDRIFRDESDDTIRWFCQQDYCESLMEKSCKGKEEKHCSDVLPLAYYQHYKSLCNDRCILHVQVYRAMHSTFMHGGFIQDLRKALLREQPKIMEGGGWHDPIPMDAIKDYYQIKIDAAATQFGEDVAAVVATQF